MATNHRSGISIDVVEVDALDIHADVLALKYAQALSGVDKVVAQRLGMAAVGRLPGISAYRLVPSSQAIVAENVLFVGLLPLRDLTYRSIREFAIRTMGAVARELPRAETVAMTLHGPGFGLDETECFLGQLGGLGEALSNGSFPSSLRRVVFAERDHARAQRLKKVLDAQLPDKVMPVAGDVGLELGSQWPETLRRTGYDSAAKPYVFVAMPINAETEDRFYYGIKQAISSCGFLCERIDENPAIGDILDRIKKRIQSAAYVVGDLSGANPNVYLEVGFAWGNNVPTILIIAESAENLRFDVSGQRCLVFSSIRDLEVKLGLELEKLSGVRS